MGEGDLEAIESALKIARAPQAMFMQKVKELQQGAFTGMIPNQRKIEEIVGKFGLDEQAVQKLTTLLLKMGKEKAATALAHLESHLERSNKPSALVMMSLAKLRNGDELGECTRGAATG